MVCFVVLDVLWFLVCVVGMISALLLWLIHHIIRGVLEENCHKTEAGICHCMGEGDVLVKSKPYQDIIIGSLRYHDGTAAKKSLKK